MAHANEHEQLMREIEGIVSRRDGGAGTAAAVLEWLSVWHTTLLPTGSTQLTSYAQRALVIALNALLIALRRECPPVSDALGKWLCDDLKRAIQVDGVDAQLAQAVADVAAIVIGQRPRLL